MECRPSAATSAKVHEILVPFDDSVVRMHDSPPSVDVVDLGVSGRWL